MPTRNPLSEDQIAAYHRDGYVVIPDILSPAEVDQARKALTNLLEFRRSSTPEENAASKMFVQFEVGYKPESLDRPLEELEDKVRKYGNFIGLQPCLAAMTRPGHVIHEALSQLIGENPILFQDMALVKPPFIGSEKPWHQDNAYFSVAPLESVCGVWIALDDATVDNGCMHVMPGAHRKGARLHIHDRDCEIKPDRIDASNIKAVPVMAGSAMFFYGMLPHQTPPNTSPARRRALQYHFRAANSRQLTPEEYAATFAEPDGTAASCYAATQRGL